MIRVKVHQQPFHFRGCQKALGPATLPDSDPENEVLISPPDYPVWSSGPAMEVFRLNAASDWPLNMFLKVEYTPVSSARYDSEPRRRSEFALDLFG